MATKKATTKPATKAPAKKAPAKGKATPKDAKKAKEKTPREPGVIASMVEFLTTDASKSRPLSRDMLLARLVKRFPSRGETSLASTMRAQLGKRIENEQGIKLHKDPDTGALWATK